MPIIYNVKYCPVVTKAGKMEDSSPSETSFRAAQPNPESARFNPALQSAGHGFSLRSPGMTGLRPLAVEDVVGGILRRDGEDLGPVRRADDVAQVVQRHDEADADLLHQRLLVDVAALVGVHQRRPFVIDER